jgi:hypothetical protein
MLSGNERANFSSALRSQLNMRRLCVTQHMNEVNISLQAVNRLASETLDRITMFERKLRLWELQLRPKHMTHLQILGTEKPTDTKKCAENIQSLQQEFQTRFEDVDLRKHESIINLFSLSFDVNVETVPVIFRM